MYYLLSNYRLDKLNITNLVNNTEDFTVENLQTTIKGWITDNEIGYGKVMILVRLALVGALQGPDVFNIMFMIGKNETVKRIENLINVSDIKKRLGK